MAEVDKTNVGDFDQLVVFKEAVKTKGDKSQIITTYVERMRAYGDVESSSAAESTVNDNVISLDKITITTYTFKQINTKWVAVWLNEIYDIVSIRPIKGTIFSKIEAQKMLRNE